MGCPNPQLNCSPDPVGGEGVASPPPLDPLSGIQPHLAGSRSSTLELLPLLDEGVWVLSTSSLRPRSPGPQPLLPQTRTCLLHLSVVIIFLGPW